MSNRGQVTPALAEAYRGTTYHVDSPEGPIALRIGVPSPALDRLLERCGADAWAYITAWNPGSRPLPVEENRRRNRALEESLRALGAVTWPGLGVGEDPAWPPEESVLGVRVGRAAAREVGARFGQNAVVVGRRGEPPELLWCAASPPEDPTGPPRR
jgi:hypothetical protein